jgi:hypothetical protein
MSARPETTQILLPDTQVVTQGNGKQVPFGAAGFLADTFVDLRKGRIQAVLRLVTRVMANSGPQGEAHAEGLLGPERARIP